MCLILEQRTLISCCIPGQVLSEPFSYIGCCGLLNFRSSSNRNEQLCFHGSVTSCLPPLPLLQRASSTLSAVDFLRLALWGRNDVFSVLTSSDLNQETSALLIGVIVRDT